MSAEERRSEGVRYGGPHESYPIRPGHPEDVRNAWDLAGHAADPAEVRRNIVRIAHELHLEHALPETAHEGGGAGGKSLGHLGDLLVFYGSEVKALGDGRVGGYLVRFSGPGDPDLTGDFFTAECDFNLGDDGTARVPLLYDHGLDPTVGKRKIGKGTVRADDVGIWLEGQLNLRDDYEKAIYAMAEKGKLGLSSGSAGHMVDRMPVGKSRKLTSWPIVEASLTPTPAEPRTLAVPLKSLAAAKAIGEGDDESGGELVPEDRAAHPDFPSARARATHDALAHLHAEHGAAVKAMLADAGHPIHDEGQPPHRRLAALGKAHDAYRSRGMAIARHLMTGPAGPDADAKGVYAMPGDAGDAGGMAAPDDGAADLQSALAALGPQFDYIRAGLCAFFAGQVDEAKFRAVLDDATEDILILCKLKDDADGGESGGVKALLARFPLAVGPTGAGAAPTSALDPAGLVAAAEGYRDLARKFAAVREADGRALGESKRRRVAAAVAGLAPVLADLTAVLETPGKADRLRAARLAQLAHRSRLAGASLGLAGPDAAPQP